MIAVLSADRSCGEVRLPLGRRPVCLRPHKTLYNRFVRWAAKCVWEDIFHAFASAGGPLEQVLIDSSAVKACRCAAGGKGKNLPRRSAARAGGEPQKSTR
jgi:hypothetical protein